MDGLAKALVGLAILGFVMAVATVFTGPILVGPEAWSRAANNLALIALALFLGFREAGGAEV